LCVCVCACMHTCTRAHTQTSAAHAQAILVAKHLLRGPLLPKRTDVETTKYNTAYTNTIENNTAYTKTRTSEADAPENGQDGASTVGFTPDAATAAVPTGEEVATGAAPVSFVCGLGGRAPKIVDPTRTLLLPIRMASS
jgi:hypothetical protein